MYYKIFVYAPDIEKTITQIISAAAEAGAGQIGNYSHCAFVHKGWGQWKTGEGATPYHGTVGEVSRMDEVKIEMRCPAECASVVKQAIIDVHPFEEVTIEFIGLAEV
ncbi:MAG: NGG1p interacting factor NIF3 [Chloroflexota bacterium]